MKTNNADKWVSKCVREGVCNVCERCGTVYQDRPGLQVHHYVKRENSAVRYDPINLTSICMGCHKFFHNSPGDNTEWYTQNRGQHILDVLMEKKRDISLYKRNRREVKEIAAHYKAEYERIMKLRSEGETRRIEVVGY